MNCSELLIGFFLLAIGGLALAAFLRSSANAAALTGMRLEIAWLRQLLEQLERAAAGRAVAPPPAEERPLPAAPDASSTSAPSAAAAPSAEPPLLAGEAAASAAVPASQAASPAPPVPPDIARPGAAAAAIPAGFAGDREAVPTARLPGLPGTPPAPSGPPSPVAPAAQASPPASPVPAGIPPPGTAAAPPPPPSPPARHTTFEELVGARLLVWVGAAALALAGAFLVKISFERGWISPPVRVGIGVAFGIALLALSEGLRRSAGRVSEALAAAGIADLFACFLAAVLLYHLVPAAAGFLLMSLTTAVAVALALRQGAMVALLGLAGGFLTPALIQTAHPRARNLFGYLLLLIAGLLAVAWRRRWRWLALAALGAGLLWAAVWLEGPFHGGDAPWLSLFLILLAAGAVLPPAAAPGGGVSPPPPPPGPGTGIPAGAAPPFPAGGSPDPALLVAVTATLALLAGTVARGGYSPAEWGFLGLLAAGVLALAWLDPRTLALAWVAAATAAVLLGAWGNELAPADSGRFLATALAAGGLFALAGWVAALAGPPHWRRPLGWFAWPEGPGSPAAHRPGQWAALSSAAGIVFFLVAWQGAHAVSDLGSEAWGGLALAAAALYLAAAVPVGRLRRSRAELTPALAAFAVAVTTLVSLSVPLALRRDSFAAAWALEVAALVWLAGRFSLPVLVLLARLLAPVAVVAALLSGAGERARGEPPIFNELLYAYGLPLAALAAAAWLARRPSPLLFRGAGAAAGGGRAATSPTRLAAELEWEAVAVGFALLTLEVHQLFQPATRPPGTGPPAAAAGGGAWRGGLAEWAAMASAWLVLGWALLVVNRRLGRQSLELAGRLILLLGLAASLAGPGLAANPLWNHEPVGGMPVWNLLVAAYALPAALAVAAAVEVRRHGGRRLPRAAHATALVLGFAWISLEVRQLFHGSFLDAGPSGAAERYAYSAAWVLYGVALLLGGIARRGPILRYGSLAVMLLAVAKVFLYDTARLSDLYRVLSFLGLGASLLLLGFLYQRFVFREDRG
jgi:uncharacterized membrane protein